MILAAAAHLDHPTAEVLRELMLVSQSLTRCRTVKVLTPTATHMEHRKAMTTLIAILSVIQLVFPSATQEAATLAAVIPVMDTPTVEEAGPVPVTTVHQVPAVRRRRQAAQAQVPPVHPTIIVDLRCMADAMLLNVSNTYNYVFVFSRPSELYLKISILPLLQEFHRARIPQFLNLQISTCPLLR